MSPRSWSSVRPAAGFTLIEVIGALLIFSAGVLMVVQLAGALGTRMRYAGARSELVVLANERLDSLGQAYGTGTLTTGTVIDTLAVEGMTFQSTVAITSVTAVLNRIDVSMTPIGGEGPSLAVTGYVSDVW